MILKVLKTKKNSIGVMGISPLLIVSAVIIFIGIFLFYQSRNPPACPTSPTQPICPNGTLKTNYDANKCVIGYECVNVIPIAVCGNNIKEESEKCDGTDFGGQTCQSHGFSGGALSCTSACTFDMYSCTTCGNKICEEGETSTNCSPDCPIPCPEVRRISCPNNSYIKTNYDSQGCVKSYECIPNVTTSSTIQVKVWILQYLPPEGIKALYPLAMADPVNFTKNTLLPAMNNASRYHGYSNSSARQALNYTLSDNDIKVEYSPPSLIGPNQYNYSALFSKYDLCNYAKQNDIKAVILWAAGSGTYQGGMWESSVTGNKGIPTNGGVYSSLCDKTIVIYGLNYERGIAEALESYGHHLEAVFRTFRPEYSSWSDDSTPQNSGLWGRGDSCGNAHNPPNARCEYDRSNPDGWLECDLINDGLPPPSTVQSDCRNWKPDGTGTKETLDCHFWGCGPGQDDGANWLIWWMQNMPGLGNNLIDSGQKIPNWWVYIGDPDRCYNNPLGC